MRSAFQPAIPLWPKSIDIEFIDDWARVPDERIAMLLAREIPASVAQDDTALERYKNEQRLSAAIGQNPELQNRLATADLEFRQTVQDAYERLRLAVEMTTQAARIGEVHSLADLDQHQKRLREAAGHLQDAREFWTDPAKAWKTKLSKEGVDEEVQETLAKALPSTLQSESARLKKVFRALDGQLESTRFLLELLTKNTDKWRLAPGERRILFTDTDFADQFKRAELQVIEDRDATEKALQPLN
jgi:hypothetical protein